MTRFSLALVHIFLHRRRYDSVLFAVYRRELYVHCLALDIIPITIVSLKRMIHRRFFVPRRNPLILLSFIHINRTRIRLNRKRLTISANSLRQLPLRLLRVIHARL